MCADRLMIFDTDANSSVACNGIEQIETAGYNIDSSRIVVEAGEAVTGPLQSSLESDRCFDLSIVGSVEE